MVKAKVFENGSGQAIQLPDDFRVDVKEVLLEKTAEGFLVIPRDPWDMFHEGCEEVSDGFLDFMENLKRTPAKKRDWTD